MLKLSKITASDLQNPKVLAEVETLLQKLFPEIDFTKNPAEKLLKDPEVQKALSALAKEES